MSLYSIIETIMLGFRFEVLSSRHNCNYEYVIRALPNIRPSAHTHTSSKCDGHHYSHNDKGHNKQSQNNPCPCRIKKIAKNSI